VALGIAREEVNIKRLTLDLNKVLRGYYDLPSRAVNMGQVLIRILNISANHKIRLPASFAVLGKVFTNIDGICSQLDPDFNFTESARTFVGKAMRKELRSENTLAELYRAMVSLRMFAISLPENMNRLVRKAVEGSARIEFKHQGLESLARSWDRALSKLSLAVIVGAIIVGSSLIVSAGRAIGPWWGFPVIGIVGYVVATILGVWLIVSIIKPGGRI
jgi:ubiquinone biosynthesis protein